MKKCKPNMLTQMCFFASKLKVWYAHHRSTNDRVPVITSDLVPMREVAGTGALLCNPEDSQTIKACIKRVLADEDLASSSQRGMKTYNAIPRLKPRANIKNSTSN